MKKYFSYGVCFFFKKTEVIKQRKIALYDKNI